MNKRKILLTALVVIVLGALVYFQVKTWRKFDWQSFKEQTEGVNVGLIALGVVVIYFDYYLRALRWKILLRPVCNAKTSRLVAPTMIGFTAMALLGRPGEFIRPFLIARKENLTMSSQLAVWVVERLFDVGAFALIMAINVLVSPGLKDLPGFASGVGKTIGSHSFSAFHIFEAIAFGLLMAVLVGAFIAFRIRSNPDGAAKLAERVFGKFSSRMGEGLRHRVHTFGKGLNTIHDFTSFLELSGISIGLWLLIGAAYYCVTHAYAGVGPDMTLASALLLTGASVAGGTMQLPVVGGGSQLATIGIMVGVFQFSKELAISCGMMLWLVTFMSVIPLGLVLAHFEHVSLRKLKDESQVQEEKALEES